MIRNVQVPSHYLAVQLFVILAPVWELPAEECEEENTRGVDVSWWSAEFNFPDDLGGHVRGRSAEDLDLLLIRNACRETKINQLDLMPLVEHYILQLDVSVSDALAVQVLQSIDQLPVNLSGLILAHPAVGLALQKAMRRPTRYILEHKDDLLLRLYGLIQCGNIWVIQSLHQPYLSPDRLLSLDILNLLLFVDF